MTLIKRIEPTVTGFTCYLNNTRVGDRATEIEAHDYLNELAYDVERGAPLPFEPAGMAQDMHTLPCDVGSADTAGAAHTERGTTMTTVTKRTKATATEYITHPQTEDANDPRTNVEAHTILEPRLRYPELPPVAISTLTDGTTVYGHFDNDDSQLVVRAETPEGWSICADETGLDLYHTTYDCHFDGMTLAGLVALRTFLNSGTVEHLLTIGAAWGNNEAVPPKQYLSAAERLELFRQIDACFATPAVQVKRWVSPESDTEEGTDYTFGMAEIHVPDNGRLPVVWLNAADGKDCPLTMIDSRWWHTFADAGTLMHSAEVQQLLTQFEVGEEE